jgi:imidazolonepropionase-like amidohydrolase
MKRQRFPLFSISFQVVRRCALVAAACAALTASARGQSTRVALTRVTIVDPVLDIPISDATIVIDGERIAAVGRRRAVAIPRGARVIDGRNAYVIPGLWDMHAHMAQPLAPGLELEANAGYFFPLFIAHGVTGVRDMAGDISTLRRWGREIAHGERVGPRLVFTGEKLGKGSVVPGAPFPIRNRADIEKSVRALWDSGAAFVKLDDIEPALFSALTSEAWKFDLRVVGHVEAHLSVREMARAGLRSVEHLDGVLLATNRGEDSLRRAIVQNSKPTFFHRVLVKLGMRKAIPYPDAGLLPGYSEARADSLFALFRTTGTWQCPTLRLLGALYHQTDANLRLAPDSLLLRQVPSPWKGYAAAPFDSGHPQANVYRRLQEIVQGMARANVGILAGTDTPGLFAVPGRSLHEELGLLVAAGLTPRQALRTATTGPADFLEERDSLGTIRVGAYADLVVLDADPLLNIANTQRIRSVFARGRYFDRATLDQMIGEGARVAQRVRAAVP